MRLSAAATDPTPLVRPGKRGRPPKPRTGLDDVNRELAAMIAADWREQDLRNLKRGKRHGALRRLILREAESLRRQGEKVGRSAVIQALGLKGTQASPAYVSKVLKESEPGISPE